MKKWSIMIGMAALLGAALSIFASCGSETDSAATASDATPLQGLSAKIAGSAGTRATRATSSEPLYVGREEFVGGDTIKMIKFCRTEHPITSFTYSDQKWQKGNEGGWTRVSDDTKIYWSDAASPHTFVGYSLPYEDFPWEEKEDVYHGHLTLTGDTIDYTSYTDAKTNVEVSGNEKLKKDDVVLTYSEKVVPDATGIANIEFRHGLACVSIDLNISGFASTSGMGPDEKDNATRVVDMKILNQPYKYKWDKISAAVTAEDETSTATIKAWTNSTEGDVTTSGRDRRFYYHTLVVPGTRESMEMEFTVTYPDPYNAKKKLWKTYTATATNVKLEGGKRTLIKISLNHKNEEMTVGTEYIDWQFQETHDEADLHKNSIYLSSISETNVVYHDAVTNADDAVWLYTDKSTADETVYDIYGNDGSEDKPYSIATADQLLCFAYEVNNEKMDFEGKYIQLDANLYMQASTSGTGVEWMGIGTSDHPFKGHFIGGLHSISRLYGSSLFGDIGSEGVVEGVSLANMLGTKNGGSVAENNAGTITGCAVNGDVEGTNLAGGICATNTGNISVCYHIGAVKTTDGTVGTIAGSNTDSEAITGTSCYAASGMTGHTVLLQCYYDTEFYSPETSTDESTKWGKTSSDLMKSAFVTKLNKKIASGSLYEYKFSPSEFPILVEK